MKHPIQQAPHSSGPRTYTTTADDILEHSLKHSSNLTPTPAVSTHEVHHRLILTLEGTAIREYLIESHSLNIGRRHGNDIQINDLTLSGRHAIISRTAENVYIEDLDSTNGTLVNGCHINKAALKHGDIIQVGHHHLTYLYDNNASFKATLFIKAEHDESQFIHNHDFDKDDALKTHSLGIFRAVRKNLVQPAPVMELRKTYNTIGFKGKQMALVTRVAGGYSISAMTGTHRRRASDIPMLNGNQMNDTQTILQTGDIVSIAGHEVQFHFQD